MILLSQTASFVTRYCL